MNMRKGLIWMLMLVMLVGLSSFVLSASLELISSTPNNNTQYSYGTQDFIIELNSTYNYSCSLYINNTLNEIIFHKNEINLVSYQETVNESTIYGGLDTGSYGGWTIITNCDELQNISRYGDYYLGNDIDCTGINFTSNAIRQGGYFDGVNYTIYNLTSVNDGLFSQITGGEFYNINLVNINITNPGTVSADRSNVGGFVGNMQGGTINKVSVTGNIYVYLGSNVGGFVGRLSGVDIIINNSYAIVDIYSRDDVGGFIGNYISGTVSNSYVGDVNITCYIETGSDSQGGCATFADRRAKDTFGEPFNVTNSYYDGDNSTCDYKAFLVYCGNVGNLTWTNLTNTTYLSNQGWDFTNEWNDSNNGTNYPFLNSKTINISSVYDGNWTTGTDINYFWVNYTKPSRALNTSLWQTKIGDETINISIPLSCWNNNGNILSFELDISGNFSCYDGTSLISVYETPDNETFYEESMWWDMRDFYTFYQETISFGNGNYTSVGSTNISHGVEKAFDGDNDTYAQSTNETVLTIYINYTKPLGALNTSLWQTFLNGSVQNNTINSSCWDYNEDILYLKYVNDRTSSPYVNISCYNGFWIVIEQFGTENGIYEEGMWWNVLSKPIIFYQEQPNESDIILDIFGDGYYISDEGNYSWDTEEGSCEGVGTCLNAFDGNWSTSSVSSYNNKYFYVNYTKPTTDSLSPNSSWQVKGEMINTTNLTIPTNCFNQDLLQFRIHADATAFDVDEQYYCYNGSSWEVLFNYSTSLGVSPAFYEDAMWWKFNTEFNDKILPNDQELYYNIYCDDGTSSVNTTNYIFYIDSTNPELATEFSESNSFYENLTGQFNFTDSFLLYSYNVSIDGISISNVTNLNTTSYVYNMSYNLENISSGWHNLTVRFADGHTANKLKGKYKIKDGWFNDYLEFTFEGVYNQGSISIKQKGFNIFDSWETEAKEDRYSFKFKPNKKSKSYIFEVEAEGYIDIVEASNSKYKKWLIYDEHWLDFYPYTDLEFNRISDNKVEVTINNVDSNLKELTFNSIGDLNIVLYNYTFYKINATVTYNSPVFETSSQTITLNITKPNLSYSTSASFDYDSTSYDLSKFIYTGSDLYTVTFTTPVGLGATRNFTFNFNFSNSTGIILNDTIITNQTVNIISIGNCSNASWAEALTFFMLNEEDDSSINASLNIDLDIWADDEDEYREFSFAYSGASNYSICIYPNESTYLIRSVMEYNAEGYEDRKYFLDGYVLDNTTDTIYLYLLNESLSTNINLKVYDKATGTSVEDAYIKILRYYPEGNESQSGGIYKTIEIEKTDENGETLAKLRLYDTFYVFVVELDNVVKLTTEVSKILTTSKVLPISLTENVLDSATRIGNVEVEVTCDKTTLICRVVWNDNENLVQEIIFEVYRSNMWGKELLYSEQATSVSGSMVYTITEDVTGNEYKATAHIHTNTEYSWVHNLASDWLNFPESLGAWGGVMSLLPAMLLIICLVFAFLSTVGAIGVIIGSILGIVGLSLLGLLSLTWGTIAILIALGVILIIKLKQ